MPQGSFYDDLILGYQCNIFIKGATIPKRFILKNVKSKIIAKIIAKIKTKKEKANKFIVLNEVEIIVNGEKIKAKVLMLLHTNIKEEYLSPKLEKAKKYKWKRKSKSLKINKKNNFNPNNLYILLKKEGNENLLFNISDTTVHEIKNIKKHQKYNNDWKEIVEQNTQKIETKLNNWIKLINTSNVKQKQEVTTKTKKIGENKQLEILEIIKKQQEKAEQGQKAIKKAQLANIKKQILLAPNFIVKDCNNIETISTPTQLITKINDIIVKPLTVLYYDQGPNKPYDSYINETLIEIAKQKLLTYKPSKINFSKFIIKVANINDKTIKFKISTVEDPNTEFVSEKIKINLIKTNENCYKIFIPINKAAFYYRMFFWLIFSNLPKIIEKNQQHLNNFQNSLKDFQTKIDLVNNKPKKIIDSDLKEMLQKQTLVLKKQEIFLEKWNICELFLNLCWLSNNLYTKHNLIPFTISEKTIINKKAIDQQEAILKKMYQQHFNDYNQIMSQLLNCGYSFKVFNSENINIIMKEINTFMIEGDKSILNNQDVTNNIKIKKSNITIKYAEELKSKIAKNNENIETIFTEWNEKKDFYRKTYANKIIYSHLKNKTNELKQYFHFQKKLKDKLQIYKQLVIDINKYQLNHHEKLIEKNEKENCIKINSYLNAWKTKIANFDNYIDIDYILTINDEKTIENKIKTLEKCCQENSYDDLIKNGFNKEIINILQQTKYSLNKIFKTNIPLLDNEKWLDYQISKSQKDLKKIEKISLPNKPTWYQLCIFKIYDLFFKLKKSKINDQKQEVLLLKEQSSIKIKNLKINTFLNNTKDKPNNEFLNTDKLVADVCNFEFNVNSFDNNSNSNIQKQKKVELDTESLGDELDRLVKLTYYSDYDSDTNTITNPSSRFSNVQENQFNVNSINNVFKTLDSNNVNKPSLIIK